MDPNIASIITAIITGIVSVVVIIIQKGQNKVINRIDESTLYFEKEKDLREKRAQLERDRDDITHEIMALNLETNFDIIKYINDDPSGYAEKLAQAQKLMERFNETKCALAEVDQKYECLRELIHGDPEKEEK